MRKFKWPLIAILASTGFLFAWASIMAWIQGWEHWIGLIMIIGIGKMTAFFAAEAPKRNAFVAGYLMALFGVWTQSAFLQTYFENNPEYAGIEIPFGLSAHAWTLSAAPIGAVFAGVLSAISALFFSILLNRTWRNRRRNA